MSFQMRLSLALLLLIQLNPADSIPLYDIVYKLNERLGINTNILYCEEPQMLLHYESSYLGKQHSVGQLLYTEPFNGTQLSEQINKNLLFVISASSPAYFFLEQLELQFQQAHFLLIIEDVLISTIWLQFVRHTWQQGYVHLLLYMLQSGSLYRTQLLPHVELLPSSVEDYLAKINNFEDLYGHEIRVATSNHPPRSLIYNNKRGERVYEGFYLRFLDEFLRNRNASLMPVIIANSSLWECSTALMEHRVDICSDALAPNPANFEITKSLYISYANVVVANAQPLATYFYLTAPFQAMVWICLVIYIALIVSLMSLIYWRQERRCNFSKFLLEAINSLICSGFSLRDLRCRERYILFAIMFIVGYICSTFYLGYLKSLLATEVFSEQINNFEQLVHANITILMEDYNQMLAEKYNLPDILRQLIRIVPVKILDEHRMVYDQDYAYIFFNDKLDLYDYAQKFLRRARMRHIPHNFFFLYAGFPMHKTWFLKEHMSRAWLNAFNSGLFKKLNRDAHYESVRNGFYHFLVTEYYEAKPLGVDYFIMPAILLGVGIGLSFCIFLLELLVGQNRKPNWN